MGVNLHPQTKIEKPPTGLEDKRKSVIVGEQPRPVHAAVKFNSLVEAVIGNKATDHGIPQENVGFGGTFKDNASMDDMTGFEAGAEDHVEEVVVMVEVETEDAGVDVFEVLEGGTTLQEAFLDLQCL